MVNFTRHSETYCNFMVDQPEFLNCLLFFWSEQIIMIIMITIPMIAMRPLTATQLWKMWVIPTQWATLITQKCLAVHLQSLANNGPPAVLMAWWSPAVLSTPSMIHRRLLGPSPRQNHDPPSYLVGTSPVTLVIHQLTTKTCRQQPPRKLPSISAVRILQRLPRQRITWTQPTSQVEQNGDASLRPRKNPMVQKIILSCRGCDPHDTGLKSQMEPSSPTVNWDRK